MNNSAIRVLDILELISSSQAPMTASEIGKALDIPKSSVFDLVNIMSKRGFITPESPYGKAYKIGVSSYRTGMAFVNNDGLYGAAHPVLKRLCDITGETCYLAVEDNGSLIYLDKVESDAPIRSSLKIGSGNSLHCTGLGKALLAAYTEERVRCIADKGLGRHTPTTICDPDTLFIELEATRKRGYAVDLGEDNELLRCVAAPVRDRTGEAVAAISVTMLASNYTGEHLAETIAALKAAALEISQKNGYMGYSLY